MDTRMGVNCPGCGTAITIDNAGGYRTYCTKCVEKIEMAEELPKNDTPARWLPDSEEWWFSYCWIDYRKKDNKE